MTRIRFNQLNSVTWGRSATLERAYKVRRRLRAAVSPRLLDAEASYSKGWTVRFERAGMSRSRSSKPND